MSSSAPSSRSEFDEYRKKLAEPKNPVKPGDKAPRKERSSLKLLRSFFGLLRGHRLSVAFALFTLTISTVLGLIPPFAVKFVVDYVLGDKPLPVNWPEWAPNEPWPLLVAIVSGVFLISLTKVGLHVWGRWHATRTTKLVQMATRKRVFEHALRLPLHRIHEMKSGGAASVLRQDAGSVGDLIFDLLYNPWRALVQLLGSLIVLAWVDWKLLLGAMFIIPCVYVTHRTWIIRIRPQFRSIRAQRERVDGRATESFGGIRVIRAFSRQQSEARQIMQGNHLMGRQELYAWWWARMIEILWETVIPLASAGLLLYGGWQVLEGELTLGDLMMFLAYLLMLLEPLAILAQSSASFQNSLSGLERVLDLLHEPRETDEQRRVSQLDRNAVQGRIELRNVSFCYPGTERYALQNISLTAEPGQTIALVGPSGAGKTTLCNLIARFYKPDDGELLLDGRDTAEVAVESYRRLLGIVEQDVFLFDGTVAENISYSRRDASDAEIRRAAEIANAADFIDRFPQQYETIIGERGVKLSGGQRQRIAIARAVLSDPKILILDEATSNLDSESERLIQESLTALMQERTSFVIAHRLSTIMQADRILVMEDAKIVEAGTHAELLELDGRYADMVALQTRHSPEGDWTSSSAIR